jgi:REP element-mobilizing transposase RayT
MDTPRDPHGRRHKRGYLPHFDAPGFTQFVTFRLNGSLPKSIFETLKFKFETKQINEIQYHREIDNALDMGNGPTHLRVPEIADMVAGSIIHFAGKRYRLHAWVIMPNHVHLLLELFDEFELSAVIHSIKSYSATKANKLLGINGRFWSPDYFDRFIRGRKHLINVTKYIEENPVKAGLCERAEEWKWCSAFRPPDS